MSRSREIQEVEVESVAYIVCDAIGLDTGEYSFAYVARWSEGFTEFVRDTAERVVACAKEILERLEAPEGASEEEATVDSMSDEASSIVSLGELERRLARRQVSDVFTEAELEGLPGPVRRYFLAAIAPGTRLATAARLEMRGSIRIGRWVPFRADEVLAPSEGFVWAARVSGIVTGSDGYIDGHGGMRWKLFGVVPFVRVSGPDYARSAGGRAGGEAIWLPTVLLPRFGVRWRAEDETNATASFSVDGVALEVRYIFDEEGRVRSLTFDRWGDPDRSGAWRMYPCGGDVTGYRRFAGLTIPSEGRLGWFYGTDRWSEGEFFRYEITQLRLLDPMA